MSDEMRLVFQLAVGIVFLASTAGKIRRPITFAKGIAQYGILPARLTFALGLALIPLEAFLALAHLTGWLLAVAVPVGIVLLLIFTAAVTTSLVRGIYTPCYCFGAEGGEAISLRSLGRLALLMAGEISLMTQPGFFEGGTSHAFPLTATGDVVAALSWTVVVLTASIWALSARDLVTLAQEVWTAPRGGCEPTSQEVQS